jgi:hypothetical protein
VTARITPVSSEEVIKSRILDLMKRADKIHFNRDLMSKGEYFKWLSTPGAKGGFTNWELKQLLEGQVLKQRQYSMETS